MKTPGNGIIAVAIIICIILYAAFKHFSEPQVKQVRIQNGYYKTVDDTSYNNSADIPFKILEEDTTSGGGKYQSLVSAALTGNTDQDEMKAALYKIYNNELNHPVFNGLTKPNSVAVYLYSSESKYKNAKGQWDMMLWKNITDVEPTFSQGNSLKTIKDSESRNEFNKIKKLFDAKGISYCDFFYQYKEWETHANQMDAEYSEIHPNDYSSGKRADKWLDGKIHSWLKSKGLPNSAGEMVEFYGPAFCK